ncbi:transcription termination factor Rho [Patescibacteria group bacterium]|nr:transcription termination factor Rho [Patescibacteria group bacterium]
MKEKFSLQSLDSKTLADLRVIAEKEGIKNIQELNKRDLIFKILEATDKEEDDISVEGILEVINDGTHGILRSYTLLPGENDVYVSASQIKKFNLKQGDYINGKARLPKDNERYLSILKIDKVNGNDPLLAAKRISFDRLTAIFPNEQIKLEIDQFRLSNRIIDLLAPIGKGQRGMIVSPPKSGKTTLLKDISDGITKNHPEIHLIILLIGERPEEVTDIRKSTTGEVFASNFDDQPENQIKVAEIALDRAKRLVEEGRDVVILMDSLTRLARAYNIVVPPSGRTLSGGFDPIALYPPKRFFGSARNLEELGSLTIIATALVDTGSRMDDLVFEEFKGTGNMELHLDRKLSERRIYPAIDVVKSGTRHEEKLLSSEILNQSWLVRRMIDTLKNGEGSELLIERLKKTKSNEEFLMTIHESI